VVTQDVLLSGGRIRSIGHDISTAGCDVIRAEGKYVLPGLVDPHVHLGIFSDFDGELSTETASALINGVTTIGLYVGGSGSYVPFLDSLIEKTGTVSRVDIFAHVAILDRTQLAEIPLYSAKYGVRSFKVYMSGIPGLIPSADDGFLLDTMEAVAALGKGAVLNIHAENPEVIEWASKRGRNSAPDGGLREWEESRPAFAEREAIQRALLLAERSGVKLYFVHVSSAEAVAFLRSARATAPGRFHAETTSPYLSMTYDDRQGALAVMSPPVRGDRDRQELWKALADGTIDTIGTDHTPQTVEEKTGGRSFWDTVPGYPAVGTHLPFLLDGARRHGLPLVRLVENSAANPARIFGLYPRKGTLLPGSDADLVIVDLDRIKEIGSAGAHSRSDFALRQGERVIGWPVTVVKGGQVLYPDDPSLDLRRFDGASYIARH
jgi:dihydropyrimidinase